MIKKTIALQLAIFLASGNVSAVESTAPESTNIDTTAGVGPAPKEMRTRRLSSYAFDAKMQNGSFFSGKESILDEFFISAILSQVVINKNKRWHYSYLLENLKINFPEKDVIQILNGEPSISSLQCFARLIKTHDGQYDDDPSIYCANYIAGPYIEYLIDRGQDSRKSFFRTKKSKKYGHVLGWDKGGDSNNKLFCKKGDDLLFKGLYNLALRQKHGTMLEDYKIWIDEGHDITKKLYNLYDSLITDESGNEILDLELKTDEMVHIQHMAMPMSKDGINCLKKRLNLDFLEKVGEFSSEDFNKDAKILIGFFEANIGKNIGENIGKNARNKKQLLKKLRDWSENREKFLGGLNSLDKICRALDEEFLRICKKVGLEWTELPFEETLSEEAKNKYMENFNKLDLKAPEVETLENETGGKKRKEKEENKSNSKLSKIEKDQSKN